MTVNYADLCAYIAKHEDTVISISSYVLEGWGIIPEEATAEELAQAILEAQDDLIEEYLTELDFLSPCQLHPIIITGQRPGAKCRLDRGYVWQGLTSLLFYFLCQTRIV